MRKSVMVPLLFVSLLMAVGFASAGGKSDGEASVKKLLARIDSLRVETKHLEVIVASAVAKDSTTGEARDALAEFQPQLKVTSSGLLSIKRWVKRESPLLVKGSPEHRQIDNISRFVTEIEGSLHEMKKEIREILEGCTT